ncbi:MAG: type II toxin-antitoxin system RelE/ParE family toxin [Myxococcales bacterium]|nr:type II toxin-antitoxin system RelE/ParE family toxin [Myxococcales bacterium]
MKPLEVFVTERAAGEIRAALRWWRANRPAAADLLAQEVRSMLELLRAAPALGVRARDARIQGVRRALLPRTRYHVYYRVEASSGRLDTLAFWHTSRTGPSL